VTGNCSLRFMVTGTRHMGVCLCPWVLERPCGVALQHRLLMDSTLRSYAYQAASVHAPVELIHGGAEGADRLAAEYWTVYELGPVRPFPANWAALGKRAGNVRNDLMVGMMPDEVFAFPWAKRSTGTRDAIRRAQRAGIRVHVTPVEWICPRVEERLDNTPH
jgi:hypothetical protein